MPKNISKLAYLIILFIINLVLWCIIAISLYGIYKSYF
jgi:hypothetical protein